MASPQTVQRASKGPTEPPAFPAPSCPSPLGAGPPYQPTSLPPWPAPNPIPARLHYPEQSLSRFLLVFFKLVFFKDPLRFSTDFLRRPGATPHLDNMGRPFRL